MKKIWFGVLFSCLVLILAPAVVAQQTNGTIQGTVTDAGGAVVAGASVSIVNQGTAYSRSLTTGPDGSYAFTELAPGVYNLKVTKDGFKTQSQQNIELHVASTVVTNAKLEVGSVSEAITVEAHPIEVERQTHRWAILRKEHRSANCL